MKRLIVALIALLPATESLPAQSVEHVFTRPVVPSREALDRLHLQLAWRTYVPLDGKRDNLFTVQIPDRPFLKSTDRGLVPSLQILIQTLSGAVIALNPETGETYWQVRLGASYRQSVPLAFNTRSVFAVNGLTLYSLDRTTGATQWKLDLPAAPTAPPVAGIQQLFICLADGKVYSYLLPALQLFLASEGAGAGREVVPPPGGEPGPAAPVSPAPPTGSPEGPAAPADRAPPSPGSPSDATTGPTLGPVLLWDRKITERVERAPLLNIELLFLTSADGTAVALSRAGSQDIYRFKTDGPIVLPPGLHSETAYLASRDNTLYAINIPDGQSAWTYTTGTEIVRKPQITDSSVYVITTGNGLQRLDRTTGAVLWRRPASAISNFLAENPKFVYAVDLQGRLVVLDRARGVQLSRLNTVDFTIPVPNEMSDRIFLAASDGLIVCLRDRDYVKPLENRREDVRRDNPRNSPLVRRLLEPVTMTAGLEETTLRDAVEILSKQYKLPIVVSERAFQDSGEPGILHKRVSLKRFEGMVLGEVLQRLLKPANATYLVHPDYVLIVPIKDAAR